MARPRKFKSARALEEAVSMYFASLLRPVSGPNKKSFPVYNGDGSVAAWMEYLLPPSLSGLCLFLGVDKSTWALWASDKTLGPVVAATRLRVEHYLETELIRRKGSTRGIEFSLQNNFRWRDKVDVAAEVSAPVLFEGGEDVAD